MVSKTYRNAAIDSGATWLIDPTGQNGGTKDYMKKFVPFNSLFIANEDQYEIEVQPNGNTDRRLILPQGSTRNLLDAGMETFQYLHVKNNGAGQVAANKVTIRIERIAPKGKKK